MSFSDIIGHRKQIETLQWSLAKERLHHAYLFVGPEGVGKMTLALALAKAIQCAEKANDFCGRCDNCVRIQSGNHPDVRLVRPAKKEITIQQVRELERELSYGAFGGGKKIAIVDPASLMNYAAQNALLKTLEEPPRDTVLILVATHKGGLLPTLVSRCLRLSFAPIPHETLANFLVAQKGLARERAELLAAVSMGSLGKALSPETDELAERRKRWAGKMNSLAAEDCRGRMELAEELAREREDSLRFLEWAEGWYRDLLIYQVTGGSREVANVDMVKDMEQQADKNSRERLLSLVSEAVATAANIRRNFNRRIALESFLARAVGTH